MASMKDRIFIFCLWIINRNYLHWPETHFQPQSGWIGIAIAVADWYYKEQTHRPRFHIMKIDEYICRTPIRSSSNLHYRQPRIQLSEQFPYTDRERYERRHWVCDRLLRSLTIQWSTSNWNNLIRVVITCSLLVPVSLSICHFDKVLDCWRASRIIWQATNVYHALGLVVVSKPNPIP